MGSAPPVRAGGFVSFVLFLTLFVFAASARSAELRPADLSDFFAMPDKPILLRFTGAEAGAAGPEYVVRDYAGREVSNGRASVEGKAAGVTLTLPAGYYEIAFPATEQTFGIVAQPPFAGKTDPFWAIDSALSWLETRPQVRQSLVEILRRSGIGMSRERLSWGAVRPSRETWEWETGRGYESLRRMYRRNGVQVLEMFHDSPLALREPDGRYPQDMNAAYADWREIARRLGSTWGAIEVWNEPELTGFGGDRPPDRLLPIVKTVDHAVRAEGVRVPIGGGVFTESVPAAYRDLAGRSGLLDAVDFVSFHIYAPSAAMEHKVGEFRQWLRAAGRESTPLWITESGLPWTRGPGRPPAAEDARSAAEVTMKAIEARACGVARFFPFVYPYYEEKEKNFGMMGKDVTPLRSMAGYVQAVRVLSGTTYRGDLPVKDPAVRRARVFGRGKERIAVLYTGTVAGDASVALDQRPVRVEGADGRRLTVAAGKVPVPDGMVYVWLPESVDSRLVKNTPAAALTRAAQKPLPKRSPGAPVVLEIPHPEGTTVSLQGYALESVSEKPLPLTVRIANFSATPQQVTLNATWEGGRTASAGPERRVTVPAGGSAEVAWKVDLQARLETVETAELRVAGKTAGGETVTPLVTTFRTERDLPAYLRLYPNHTKLPIAEPERWRSNIMPTGQMRVSTTSEGAWRLDATFGKGDPWVYPLRPLADGESLKGASALLIRARAITPGTVRLMAWERGGGHYLTPAAVIPADGRWFTRLIRLSDFARFSAGQEDPNNRLDADQIERLSIGMNASVDAAILEVSDLYIVRGVR